MFFQQKSLFSNKIRAFPTKISAYQQAGTPMVDLNESGLAQDWQATGRMNATEALMGMIFLTIALFDGRS